MTRPSRIATTPLDQTYSTQTRARNWEDGLVAGGGRLGALLYGDESEAICSLSHEHFFIPANPTPAAPQLHAKLREITSSVLTGATGTAGDLLDEAGQAQGFSELVWTNPLGMCATVVIRPEEAGVDEFVRRTDLRTGEISLQWRVKGEQLLTASVVVPREESSAYFRLTSSKGVRVRLELGLPHGHEGRGFMGARNALEALRIKAVPGQVGVLSLASTNPEQPVSVTTVAYGVPEWSELGQERLCAEVELSEEETLLRFDVVVSREESAPAPNPVDASWDAILERQRATHGELIERSQLDLGAPSSLDTDEIWAQALAGDEGFRRRAVEVAYASGRCNAISATGDLPPTLQGVWQGTWTPAWSADYTLNGNVLNGGMACLIPCGTPELARALVRLVLPHLEDYRANAANVFGASGVLLPSRMSDNGRANHFSSQFPHLFWTGCGPWVLRIVADIVSTTGDRSLVDDELWQLIEGVLQFAETSLVKTASGRQIAPGFSPENTPFGEPNPIATDPTMDVALLRDAARATRLLGKAFGDSSLDARWDQIIAELPPYRVADDGTLAEWLSGNWRENHAHRHASQLYPLWYEVDEAFLGDSDEARSLRQAALTTIATKIAWRAEDPTPPPGRMEMAFGLIQLGVAAAQLGDAAAALQCAEWLAIQHWTPALTTTHDAGAIFNMDASGGLPALVASMLVGSTVSSLTVLPALPMQWEQGHITGLTARGGVVVESLTWDEDGGELLVSRRPEAAWMHEEDTLLIHVGSGFTLDSGQMTGSFHLGPEPRRVKLRRPR